MHMIAVVVQAVVAFSAMDAGIAAEGVPAARVALLSKGVNIPHWFWIGKETSDAYVRSYFTEADAKQLRELGLTHVRVPVAPGYVWDAGKHEIIGPHMAEYRRAVSMIVGVGLGVIVDPHYSDEATPWLKAGESAGKCEELERFWTAFAGELAATDPERVVLELLNEPHDLKDKGAWTKMQTSLAAVVRKGAPKHTILATGDEWGGVDGLVKMEPLADANVIYSFHFYEPMTFTHQAATWGAANWKHLSGVPYPAAAKALQPIMKTTADQGAKGELEAYGKAGWNAAKIEERIARVATWGEQHHVAIYCGEFGVHRKAAPDGDRGRWLHDVSQSRGKHHIGWAMWDYAGGFSLMDEAKGGGTGNGLRRRANTIAANALDLTLPRPPVVEPPPAGPSAAPPADAIVLFDGTSVDGWTTMEGKPAGWKTDGVRGGAMTITPGSGSIISKTTFGDAIVHVEFMEPKTDGQGQDRGNSGVYLQARYEVQVLDSYKSDTYPQGQCGAIYGQHVPLVNVCRPPEQWQTYDIEFHAAKFDADGRQVAPARATVHQNGVLIHDDVPIAAPTGSAPRPEDGTPGPLYLQDHGHAVKFRNVWIKPMNEAR